MVDPTPPMTVGVVAGLAGVTVRTLHHYDEVGLLSPSSRTAAGYRLYDHGDLTRLQQILYYRELGFSLDDIATLLDDPDADPAMHLRRQRDLVGARIERLQQMLCHIDHNLEARTMEIRLTPDEMLEVFGEEHAAKHEEYTAEAEDRWGGTDAWAQSRRRTSSYTKADWEQAMAEQQAAAERLAATMQADLPADTDEAMDAAEDHRQAITRWFYDCSHETHRGLGDMYVADPRFTQTYEQQAAGLATYIRDAIHANADRAGA